ncbi:hypothetical protein AAG906_029272 [Vitis piasezkii]
MHCNVCFGYALHKRDIDVTILQLDKCILQWMWCFMKIRCIFHLSLNFRESTIRKFRLLIMIIISLKRMNRTIELVNREAGELDMSGQQFGSENVFTEIPNQSSSVEGVLNLELIHS